MHKVYNEVEWASVLFFVGLFMMVGGLVELGVLDAVADFTIELTQGNVGATALLIMWLSAVLSAVGGQHSVYRDDAAGGPEVDGGRP